MEALVSFRKALSVHLELPGLVMKLSIRLRYYRLFEEFICPCTELNDLSS